MEQVTIDKGVKIKEGCGLNHWESLLEEWIFIFSKYCQTTNGDSPCLNRERANVGLLASAAWRNGQVSLEEWPIPKKADASEENKNGRNDLWIGGIGNFYDYVEAKWMYLCVDNDKFLNYVQSTMEEARVEADKIIGDDNPYRKIGISFLCFCFPKENIQGDNINNYILEKINAILALNDYDFYAWCFPQIIRKKEDGGKYFPGVMLIGKQVER